MVEVSAEEILTRSHFTRASANHSDPKQRSTGAGLKAISLVRDADLSGLEILRRLGSRAD